MPGKKQLPHALVSQIKMELLAGGAQKEIADRLNVSTATVSLIKTGKRYGEVPWPNGRAGSYDAAYSNAPGTTFAAEGWTELAQDFNSWPQYYQMKMLEAVNKKREERGESPIPGTAVEWEMYMMQPISKDPKDTQRRERLAKQGEDRRRSVIMKEFNHLREQLAQERSTENFKEMMEKWKSTVTTPSVTPDPEFHFALSEMDVIAWEDVDVNHPERAKAIREKDPWRMAAICVFFRIIKPEHRGRSHVAREVERIRGWIKADPVAAEYAQKEWGKYVPMAKALGSVPDSAERGVKLHRE